MSWYKGTKNETVDEYSSRLDPKRRKLVERLRRIVKKTLPGVQEQVKWGNPTYILDGTNIAWILVYPKTVNLGFFRGAELKSPLLEGTGKGLRHIKIRSEEDFKESEFAKLLKGSLKNSVKFSLK